MRKLTLLFPLAAGSAPARDEILEINNWRMHEGDDPAWADDEQRFWLGN